MKLSASSLTFGPKEWLRVIVSFKLFWIAGKTDRINLGLRHRQVLCTHLTLAISLRSACKTCRGQTFSAASQSKKLFPLIIDSKCSWQVSSGYRE